VGIILTLSNEWDIHSSGHCFHPSGLDVYWDSSLAYGNARCVLGPYSRGTPVRVTSEWVVSCLRDLVGLLEINWFEPNQFTLFGVEWLGGSRSGLPVKVLGSDLLFSPNPTLRAKLWDDMSVENKVDRYDGEWTVCIDTSSAFHASGIHFRYVELDDLVRAEFRGAGTVAKCIEFQLLEILAEQGYSVLKRFSSYRLFRRFDLVEANQGSNIVAEVER